MEKEEKAPQIEETKEILNPFVHRLELNTAYERFKLVFMSVFVLPFRVLGIIICLIVAYILASTGLYGLSRQELSEKPMSGWRRKIRWYMGLCGKAMMRCYAFQWVKVKGRRASRAEAPILIVSPHSSFFDCIAVHWSGVPCLVNRIENLQLPLFGKYIDYTQPVYVWREDTNSRQNTIQEIKRRAVSDEDWPQIMVFPEGTCTNRSCLITFKAGAFYPGVPVQPVVIRYLNRIDSFTWTWDGPGALKMLWVTLCQFHNFVELEYLPVYTPSEEEKQDAKLFASNVRQVMADALGVPVADYSYDDCRLMHKAKLKKLPYQTGLIEFQKLRHCLGVDLKKVEEELLSRYAEIAVTNGLISLKDFAKYLNLPEYEPSVIETFNLYDEDGSGTIDFREFIIGTYKFALPELKDSNVEYIFKLLDPEGKGELSEDDFVSGLISLISVTKEEAVHLFKSIDLEEKGVVSYDTLKAVSEKKPEYAAVAMNYIKSIKSGTRSEGVHRPPEGKKKAD